MQLLLRSYVCKIRNNVANAIFFRFSSVPITQETFTATLAKFDREGDFIYIYIYIYIYT